MFFIFSPYCIFQWQKTAFICISVFHQCNKADLVIQILSIWSKNMKQVLDSIKKFFFYLDILNCINKKN